MRVFGYIKGLENARLIVRQHWRECQEEAIREYCCKNRFELVQCFVETHPSAPLEQRPVLNSMLESLKNHEAEGALVVATDPPKEMLDSPFVLAAEHLLKVVEVRACGMTNCLGTEGLCGNGIILAPHLCVFQ